MRFSESQACKEKLRAGLFLPAQLSLSGPVPRPFFLVEKPELPLFRIDWTNVTELVFEKHKTFWATSIQNKDNRLPDRGYLRIQLCTKLIYIAIL